MTLNVYAGIMDQEKARTADIMGKLIDVQRWKKRQNHWQKRDRKKTEFTRQNETGWILVQSQERKKGFTTRI